MNMKKKSLVAGLLAVSLAAQPVAATIAPKAVYAEDTTVVTEEGIKNVNGYIEGVKHVVKTYKNEGMKKVTGSIKLLEAQFPKFSTLQQSIIKAEEEYTTYELIVKEWKETLNVTEADEKAAAEYVRRLVAKYKNETFEDKDASALYEEYNAMEDKIKDLVKKYNGDDEEGNPKWDSKEAKYTDALVGNISGQITKKTDNLNVSGSLEEIDKFIADYNKDAADKENPFKVYGKDVRTKDVADAIKGLESRVEDLGNVILPVYNLEEKSLLNLNTGEAKEETTVKDLKEQLEKYKNLPKVLTEEITINYYDKEAEPVKFKVEFKDNSKLHVTELNAALKALEASVKTFTDNANGVINAEKPSKFAAVKQLEKYDELKEGVKNSIDKDLIAKLNAIVEGKPVAPVKETYYSLGVNVRDLEGNIVTRLDRGTEIPEAVREGNKIKFVLEGKEVTAHIKFVTTEKPLDVFYSKGGNVRETPEVKGLKLGYLPVNKIVLGEVVEGKEAWVEIDYNGKKAYIAKNRLADKAIEEKYVSVGARVRDLNGKEIGYLKSGVEITGTANGNNIEFTYKGQKAVVHKLFVNKK